jgi:hypothetical protein
MLKYLTKFAMDILPSVAATIIGAYVVNHYINAKPASEAPVAAAVSAADPKVAADGKPAVKPFELSSLPAAGVKAKGISERTLLERSASEKGAVIEKPQEKSQDKSGDVKSVDTKPADAPAETASIPAEPRRHAPASRERAVARLAPPPAQSVIAPVVATPAPAAEAAPAPEERRDANDLARAAIERLRGSNENSQRPQEAARAQETPRIVSTPSVKPLPPPIMVSTPAGEALDQGSQPKPPYAANAGIGDPGRPTPPADIPLSRPPLDLRAEASSPAIREHNSVAEEMLSAAKSVFHSVLPK